jgi:hypothetical protein
LNYPEGLNAIGARAGSDCLVDVLLRQPGRGAAEHHKAKRIPELRLQCQDVFFGRK